MILYKLLLSTLALANTEVAQAAADKESNDAAVEAQTEIAKKQNELAIKKSELQMEADTKKAMADAAYEIQKEEQRKTIEVTTANADIAKQEREIELKQKQVAVTEKSLEAEVKKKAEADKYAAQQRAEADLYQRQKDAEAKQFEAQRAAEAQKAEAEAMRYAKEQEAAGIRAVGEAEASAIQAKGIAEAEAMEKKAEAYAKYNKAAVAEMMIKVLPDIAGKVAEPLGQIDKITIIGGGEGGSNGVDQVAGNVPVVMAKVFESMKEATGIDLADIINAESYDAKVNTAKEILAYELTKLVHGEEEADKAQAAAKALFVGGGDDTNMPTTEISAEKLQDGKIGILNLMVACKLASSNKEARRLVEQGGVFLNDEKVEAASFAVTEEMLRAGVKLRKGKKVFHKAVLA